MGQETEFRMTHKPNVNANRNVVNVNVNPNLNHNHNKKKNELSERVSAPQKFA